MYLKPNINAADFLRRVTECEGKVTIHTIEGDILNLHSTLCRMIFTVAAAKEHIIRNAQVICENDSDYSTLEDFIIEQPY